jgi:hypothetical protein
VRAAVEVPAFSAPHGFYAAPFDLTITSGTANAVIRYTLDGSDPRNSPTSLEMASPAVIRIDPESTYGVRGTNPGVVVRACGTAPGTPTSDAAAGTYIFRNKIVSLSPEGKWPGIGWPQPTASANPQSYDYGMAPAVLNDARYAKLIDSALVSIPSLSIATDSKYLFSSDSGIYQNAMLDGDAWERPASFELLNPDGSYGFQINAGLRIRGGWSRHGDNPKHAFRFLFKSKYGKGKLEYPLFETEGAARFDKIDIRTGQNYAWSYPGHLGRVNTMISDVFSRDLQREMGRPYTRSRFYHLYLNGVYWGLFQTQERAEAKFAVTYFGGSDTDYDVVKVDDYYSIEATDGNLLAYQEVWNACLAGFKADTSYFNLQGMDKNGIRISGRKSLVDVPNLADFMLIIFYTGNFDSPVSKFGQNNRPNNFYAIYNRRLNDGFRFFSHDAEHTLRTGAGEGPGIGLNENRVNIGTLTDYNKMTVTAFSSFTPQWIHFRLSENAEYRMLFADQTYRHFFNQGCMTPERSKALFQARANEIDMAIIAESARWGNTYLSPAATKDDDWKPAISDILNNYFPYRFALVLNQLRIEGLYPYLDPPVFLVDGDPTPAKQLDLAAGASVRIQNPLYQAGTVYYTGNGDDPRSVGGGVSATAVNGGAETTITPEAAFTLKARVLNGTIWSALHEILLKGTPGTTDVKEGKARMPSGMGLVQNFPNPFNPATRIRYSLARPNRVTISIHNTLGETVDVLVDAYRQAGVHDISWNASRHPSGMYVCRMTVSGAENFSAAKKLLLMK